jgi:hypothetical protein
MGLYDFWEGECPNCNTKLPDDLQQKITGGAFRSISPGCRFKYFHADYLQWTHSGWVKQQRSVDHFPQGSGEFAVGDKIECEGCGNCLVPILHIDDDNILTHRRYAMVSSSSHKEIKLALMHLDTIGLCDGEVSLGDVGVVDGSSLEFVMAPLQGSCDWRGSGFTPPKPKHGWRGPFSPAKDGPLKITITHNGLECEIGVAIDSTVGSLAARAAFEFKEASHARAASPSGTPGFRCSSPQGLPCSSRTPLLGDEVYAITHKSLLGDDDCASSFNPREEFVVCGIKDDKFKLFNYRAERWKSGWVSREGFFYKGATSMESVLQVLSAQDLDEPIHQYLKACLLDADTIQDWIETSQDFLSPAVVEDLKARWQDQPFRARF